jgi:hypothetical protein
MAVEAARLLELRHELEEVRMAARTTILRRFERSAMLENYSKLLLELG